MNKRIGKSLWGLIIIMGLVLSSCAPAATPAPPEPVATEPPVIQTVEVEVEKTVEVVVTKEVVKEIQITPTPMVKDEITIALGTAFDHVVSFAAAEKGIWDKHGFDVKFKIVPTGVDQIAAMQAGEAQFAQAGSFPIASAISQGVPVRMLGFLQGASYQAKYDPDMAVVARGDVGIEGIADLKGKKIGVPVGTVAHEYLLALLSANGIQESDVSILNIKDTELRIAIENGDVDAIACWEAFPSTILVKVPGTKLVQRDGGYIARFGTLITLQDILDENPEMVKRYLLAFSEAQKWVREHPDEAGVIATRWIGGLDPDVARAVARTLAYDPRISEYSYMGWEESVKFLVAQGRVPSEFDVRAAFAPEFMLEIMEEYPELFSDLPEIPADKQLKP